MARKRTEGTRRPNGASTIYLGTDGKWHGRVTVGTKDNGEPDRRHVKRGTEKDVIDAVRKLEQQRETGKVSKAGQYWTVERWLTHWVEKIAQPSVRPNTMVGYRSSVYLHIIPRVGAHRLEKLRPEHLETLYQGMTAAGFKPATAHMVHRTIRNALNEAMRRRHITENPATIAKAPRVEEEEIIPFTRDEARRILDGARNVRNGARFVVALSLGLRRGEALGLKWDDVEIRWSHGCPTGDLCREENRPDACENRRGGGKMIVRRTIQLRKWQHGCIPIGSCGRERGMSCPDRHSGGLVTAEVKSRAGRRAVGIPHQVAEALTTHQLAQQGEQEIAGSLWKNEGWVFTNHVGGPVQPTEDHRAWKALLVSAGVRDARLHDARHTAATMLLVLGVPLVAVMELMGWSDASMARRYMHVTEEIINSVADQVSGHLWGDQSGEGEQTG
jgi:integrase